MKKISDKEIEEKIKKVFAEKSKNIKVKEEMYENIQRDRKDEYNMKKKSMKKVFIAATCVFCCMAVTGIMAAGRISSWHSSSNHNDDIRNFPSSSELEEKAGFLPKYKEKVGKYEFDYISIADTSRYDADGNEQLKSKDIYFNYKGGKEGERFVISALCCEESDFMDIENAKIIKKGDMEFEYHKYLAVYLPPSYEEDYDIKNILSEEEWEMYENGDVSIAYGTDDIIKDSNKSLCWYADGIQYNMLSVNGELEEDEMVKMAEEIMK